MTVVTSTITMTASVQMPAACPRWTNANMSAYLGGQAPNRALGQYRVSERDQEYQTVHRPKPVGYFALAQVG